MNTFFNDMKYALRLLLKSPGFTVVAVVTLALGIGFTTAFMSVFRALYLDPIPYSDPDRLVHVWSNIEEPFVAGQCVSPPDFCDIREQATSFVELGAYSLRRYLIGGDQPGSVRGGYCSAGVFRAFDVPPFLGRWFTDEEEMEGARVVILSHALWKERFGSDPDILDRSILLNSKESTVIGVMPADFEFQSPRHSSSVFALWTPRALQKSTSRGGHWLQVVGRLHPEATVASANAEVQTIGARLEKLYPVSNRHKPFAVRPLFTEMTRTTAPRMWILLTAVSMVLLVSCANVAGMQLARSSRRAAEFAVRLSLGSSRMALVRLLLMESLILGLLSSGIGCLIASGSVSLLRAITPVCEIRRAAIEIDGGMLLFAVALAVLTALLFGLFPAFAAAKTRYTQTMKECGGTSGTDSRSRHRLLKTLMTAQIAVVLLLANSGVLLVATHLKVFDDNCRYNTQSLLTAEMYLAPSRYNSIKTKLQFWETLSRQAKTLPGVQSAAISINPPFEGGEQTSYLVKNQSFDPTIKRPLAQRSYVCSKFFDTMGLSLMEGRTFQAGDAEGQVPRILINQAMAEQAWPDQSPIGQRISSNEPELLLDKQGNFRAEVAGVVENFRQQNPEKPPMPEIYFPLARCKGRRNASLIVAATGDSRQIISGLRTRLTTLDPELTFGRIRTMAEVLHDSTRERHFLTLLTNSFMMTALLIAAVGIYGTLSYLLLGRTREIGIRMAMGAQQRNIIALVVRQTVPWVITGGITGLLLSVAFIAVFRSVIPGINPFNALFFAASVLLVIMTVLVACWLPTRKATRLDPMEALRHE